MTSLNAWLRVDEQGQEQWIFIEAGQQLTAVAQILFKRAAQAAQSQLKQAGVYRLSLTGDLNMPQIEISQLASAQEHFICAQVLREADEQVRVVNLRFSAATRGPKAGQKLAPDHLSRLVSEAVATRTEDLILDDLAPIEIIFK